MPKSLCSFILIVSLCFSCGDTTDNLEAALRQAGENRPELEKVLAHYKQNPEDRLKYRAAVFLIENMPDYYYYVGDEKEAFRDTVISFGLRNDYPVSGPHLRIIPTEQFEDRYVVPDFRELEKVYDIHVITAEYLIENIELAFEAWEQAPWGKTVTFAEFCERILPYRLGVEPLENWRRQYREAFQPILDELLESDDPFIAGQLLYDTLYNSRWIFDNQVSSEVLGASSLLACRVGSCRLLADYAVFIFRAVGIPCGIDCILQNPDMMYRFHYWNYLKDLSGRTIPFEMYQSAPSPDPGKINRKKGKVYRIHYDKQPASIALRYGQGKIPPPLDDPCLTDVSAEYFEGATVEYQTGRIDNDGGLFYIGVFNNRIWVPITCSKANRGKVVFDHLECGIVYKAFYYRDEVIIPFSVPFIIQENGQPYFLLPDVENVQTMQVERKHPFPDWLPKFKHRSVGGLFQGANRNDFSDAVTLYTTTIELDTYYHRIRIDNPNKFKYLRYYAAPDSRCNMAELQFFNGEEELTGQVIGTEGSSCYTYERSKYVVFDKDPLTYYDSLHPDSAWVGLALDKPSAVTEIEYLFRNDDNGIREGDVYELYYFSSDGLISLGKRTGIKNGVLTYENAPTNALFWLRNHTRGREERIFTYENGRQNFW